MKTFLLGLLTLPFFCAVAVADDPPEVDWHLAHPKAKTAIKEYEATTKKLNEQYKARHKKDLDTLQEALTKVMKEQAQATDIDGAAKTKAVLTAIAAGAEPPVADATEKTPPAKPIYVDELAETGFAVGWGDVGKKGALGYDNAMISVRGKRPQHGISTHARSNGIVFVEYAIDGKYKTFKASVALNDSAPNGTPVTFKVVGDGKELWKSAPVAVPGAVQNCVVKVAGVKVFRLEVECLGDFNRRHAVWLEPQLR